MMISETDCWRAAKRLRMRMKIHGGAWVVQVHDGIAYEMVDAGSQRAARVLRSGSPCVAGTFTADIEITELRDALAYARLGETEHKRRKRTAVERAWHTKYKRGWRERRRVAGAAA